MDNREGSFEGLLLLDLGGSESGILNYEIQVENIWFLHFSVLELSRLKDEEISAAAIKAQFEKQLLTERTLKTQVCI